MEEQGEEKWVQESPSQESKVRLILNKGWWVGKKIVITGVAISSAPFVLPPLVVFSTLGVAFAVPFGVVFASYACTETIMSKLFPMPDSPLIFEYETWNDEENDGLEEGMDWEHEEEEEEFMEDVKQGLETRTERVEDETSKQDKAEVVAEENVNNAAEAQGKLTDEIKGARMGEKKYDTEADVIEQEEKPITEADRVVEVYRNGDVVDIAIEEEEKPLQHRQNIGKIRNKWKQTRVLMGKFDGKTAEKRDEKHAKKGENKLVEGSVNKDAFLEKSIGDKISETLPMIPSSKVLLSEEKIWEQIDAMRTIVGYKAARHATCIEELKALYVFSGVEPPASFRDSSDLAEISYKLGFLMSIVGVK